MEHITADVHNNEKLLGIIQEVRNLLRLRKRKQIIEHFKSLHAADAADVIEALSPSEREQLIKIIRKSFDGSILTELEDDVRAQIISQLKTTELVEALSNLDSDDAVYVIEDLEQAAQARILKVIPKEDRHNIETALAFPEDSAGRIMQREMVVAPEHWSIAEVINSIKKNNKLPEFFYNVFIVDLKLHPIGYLPLNKLFKHPANTNIINIKEEILHSIPATMDQEEVAFLFRKYALVSAPVIDNAGRIIGIITVDDIVGIIEAEATEDIMHLGGVADSDIHSNALTTSYWRFRWLFVTFINTLIASAVISQFQDALEEIVVLAVLMPIVAAMGGNAGMQAVTVTVRALAMKAIIPSNTTRVILKELAVGAILGITFAAMLASLTAIWTGNIKLGLVLATAMIFNTVWAAFAGTIFPIIIDRLKLDPAVAAGPLLTTTTDVLGFASFLWLARWILL